MLKNPWEKEENFLRKSCAFLHCIGGNIFYNRIIEKKEKISRDLKIEVQKRLQFLKNLLFICLKNKGKEGTIPFGNVLDKSAKMKRLIWEILT